MSNKADIVMIQLVVEITAELDANSMLSAIFIWSA
jgi:hypothetical protein